MREPQENGRNRMGALRLLHTQELRAAAGPARPCGRYVIETLRRLMPRLALNSCGS
jgi:hypothetical protein